MNIPTHTRTNLSSAGVAGAGIVHKRFFQFGSNLWYREGGGGPESGNRFLTPLYGSSKRMTPLYMCSLVLSYYGKVDYLTSVHLRNLIGMLISS